MARKLLVLMIVAILVLAGCAPASTPPEAASLPTSTATPLPQSPPSHSVGGELQSLPFADELQKVLEDGLNASNGAGISAAVIVPGYKPWVGVSGYSAVRSYGLVPMRPDMLFQIGSIEKNFTAALMLQLVEEGRLSLDDPISRWVSGYEQIDPSITIHQLLNHTSGIYDWEDNPRSFTGLYQSEGYQAIDWNHIWTLDDVMALVEKPDFPPGHGWHYSNTGYRLARVIIEAETGMPISRVLRTRLLEPLSLDHTWVECDQPAPKSLEFAHAWANVNEDDNLDDISTQSPNLYCTILSSPTWTTAEDLARWSQALFYEGRVLSQESLAEMLTFIPASDPTEPLVAEYGLGVGKFNFKLVSPGNSRLAHLVHYGHSGDVTGYDAMMIYLPEHHATVVALFNENATIGFTAGPLLEVVDRNLSAPGMSTEIPFRIAFWVLFGGLIVMQVYFASRVHQAGERVRADRKAIRREGWGYVVVRIFGSFALIAFLVLYAINPAWLGVLSVSFPDWLRWVGVVLGCASFGLYTWAQATLGKEWSPHLQMREKHHLVTSGPYARMRHPIYSAYIIFMTSIALATANWFFIGLLGVSIVVFAFRIPKEEQMLIEVFGEEYKTYMQRTGGLFPK